MIDDCRLLPPHPPQPSPLSIFLPTQQVHNSWCLQSSINILSYCQNTDLFSSLLGLSLAVDCRFKSLCLTCSLTTSLFSKTFMLGSQNPASRGLWALREMLIVFSYLFRSSNHISATRLDYEESCGRCLATIHPFTPAQSRESVQKSLQFFSRSEKGALYHTSFSTTASATLYCLLSTVLSISHRIATIRTSSRLSSTSNGCSVPLSLRTTK